MNEERRGLIRVLLGGGFAASVVSFLYPALRFMNPPAVPEAAVNEVGRGQGTGLKLNSGKIVKFGSRPVLLIRIERDRVAGVFGDLHSSELHGPVPGAGPPDLVRLPQRLLRPERASGSGPPPRPLEEYTVHVRGEEVVVSRRA